jgi:hypothetical protein
MAGIPNPSIPLLAVKLVPAPLLFMSCCNLLSSVKLSVLSFGRLFRCFGTGVVLEPVGISIFTTLGGLPLVFPPFSPCCFVSVQDSLSFRVPFEFYFGACWDFVVTTLASCHLFFLRSVSVALLRSGPPAF